MKKAEICYISHNPTLSSLIKQCFTEIPEPPLIIEAEIAAAETIAYTSIGHGIEVFVTTENNARYLKTRLSMPIVSIPLTAFDTVCALKEASTKYGHPIAFFQFLYHDPLLSAFKEIINGDIQEFVFRNKEDARDKIILAKKEGFKAIVCGGLVYTMAQQAGCKRVLLIPQKEAILYSYEQAQQVVLARHTERRKAMVFRCVVENSFDGIIATRPSATLCVKRS
jgi:hypothetical protein